MGARTRLLRRLSFLLILVAAVFRPSVTHAAVMPLSLLQSTSPCAVVTTATYDPYGALTAHSGTATTPFGFAGQYTDAESGLQYLRARYYDPATEQFLTVDPLVDVTGQPYVCVGGSPLNGVDPNGKWLGVDDAVALLVGGVVGGTSSLAIQAVTTGQVDWGQVAIDAGAGAVGAEVALYAGPIAGGAAAGLVSNVGSQLHTNGGWCHFDVMEAGISAIAGGAAGGLAGEANQYTDIGIRGSELRMGNDFRIAPFGNHGYDDSVRWPHYHRRVVDPETGATFEGQGIGRHRPWQTTKFDRSFWDRF